MKFRTEGAVYLLRIIAYFSCDIRIFGWHVSRQSAEKRRRIKMAESLIQPKTFSPSYRLKRRIGSSILREGQREAEAQEYLSRTFSVSSEKQKLSTRRPIQLS